MSSILKALKKLEIDKATRRPDELKIDSEILRSDNSPRISSSGVILASLLLLAGGSGATYMYMKQDRSPGITVQKTDVLSRQNQRPVSDTPDIKTERLPEEVVVVPAQQQKTAPVKTPKPQQPQTPTRSAPAVAASKPTRAVETSRPVKHANTSLSTPPAPVSTVPYLRVNGIALQDGMDSVAIINGVPVSSGSVIDGVKIEEILKNRVKFSYNGEKFEITLGQSNR